MSGIDPQIPITMLPVRIETRFAGTPASPRLQVRLYPDDVHVDHHDPRLTSRRGGGGEALLDERPGGDRRRSGVGATAEGRRSDARDLGSAGADAHERFWRPDVSGRGDGRRQRRHRRDCARAAGVVHRSRALRGRRDDCPGKRDPGQPPGGHLVRRRPRRERRRQRRPETTRRSFSTKACAGWSISTRRSTVGMAVTVESAAADEFRAGRGGRRSSRSKTRMALRLIAALVESHRLSDGAAFIPAGHAHEQPRRFRERLLDHGGAAAGTRSLAPADGSVAAVLAAAWSIDPMVLAPIEGAASRELDEARLMGRALFEATWGSYLREQAQPGFDLNLLPQVYAHVTSFVRGGGPLPAIRLGRQPYAIAPVMARGAWAPVDRGRIRSNGWRTSFRASDRSGRRESSTRHRAPTCSRTNRSRRTCASGRRT